MKSLTFTEKPNMVHKKQEWPEPKTVRTLQYECAYVTVAAVLIIFSVLLQTVINLRMLSIAGQHGR